MTAIRFALLAPLALAATLAHADSDRYTLSSAYVQECGACHSPYPPALLPKESWQRLMGSLDKHYGTDASLDAAAQKSIGDWVLAHAGSGKRARTAPPEDRITRGDWFIREHREVPKAAWSRPAIKSASNCGACHRGAAEGDYDENGISIPR
jgi:Dihaem cytochrome c